MRRHARQPGQGWRHTLKNTKAGPTCDDWEGGAWVTVLVSADFGKASNVAGIEV